MKSKLIVSIICILMIFTYLILPVSANSAQQHWSGTDAAGVVVTGGDCPIVVESELLTFDLNEFPSNYYNSSDDFAAYSGKVTAEYTFYNPSDMTVTATLAFPFGNLPGYAHFNEMGDDEALTEKYGVEVNGEKIEATLRHTLSSLSDFNLESDLPLLSDDYITSGIYSPDTTVTVYYWNMDYTPTGNSNPTFACDIGKADGKRVYYFPRQSCGHMQEDGSYRIGGSTGYASPILYVIGEPLTELPIWRMYDDAGCEDKDVIASHITLYKTETISLLDFALANRDEDSQVSEIDWYNAVVSEMVGGLKQEEYPVLSLYSYSNNYSRDYMRWYQYDITLAPGERITNTVTAPMYPAIDMSYLPTIFNYTYLTSPASTWADFGELKMVINTPYHLTESNVQGFEKTEGGYEIVLDGLPKDGEGKYIDLKFTLSTEENPVPRSQTPGGIVKNITYFILFFWPFILIGLVLISIVVIIIVRKKKR